jgi:NAD dependent epimerase/dehydratase
MKDVVAVSGADGFIGSHLAEYLVSLGYKVRALSQYNSFGHRGWLDQLSTETLSEIEFHDSDIRDSQAMRKFVDGADYVLHLAALIGIPYSYLAPQSYVDVNVSGTLNLLQAALESNVKGFVQTSTSEVYGTAETVPMSERHPLKGQSPYSASKIAADQLAFSYWSSFELPVSIIRPFNTFGPRQSSRAIIPTIITQIANGRQELSLGNLDSTRDMNFVKETVRAFEIAMRTEGAFGKAINVGSGFEISIRELALRIANQMNTEISFKTDPNRLRPKNSEVERLVCDAQLAERILGWKPSRDSEQVLNSGITQTIEWFIKPTNLELYRRMDYVV